MSDRTLSISLPARVVGELVQQREGQTRWHPEPTWEAEGQVPRLGMDFLRTPGDRRASSELPAWFENLLPERDSPLRSRLCELHGLREGASFALLGALGEDLPGAVEASGASSGVTGRPRVRRRAAAAEVPGEEVLSSFSALAGMQMKFSMSMVGDRLTLPARSSGLQWIVKLAGADYAELAEVETATMTWASKAGFPVPAHRTVPFAALHGIPDWFEHRRPAFAIERFDRRADGSKVHHEDLCQALGLRPSAKNGDGRPGVRYEGALRLVHDACGEADARAMARRIGFMIASGNGDAHLKNWGLLWGDQVRPSLSPCYDLVSTIAWDRFGWKNKGGPRLALALGRTRRFADVDGEMLRVFAEKTRHAWVEEEVMVGVISARDAWADVDVPIPERMRVALGEHWRRVPLLREVEGGVGV